jgi:hypothetical protein
VLLSRCIRRINLKEFWYCNVGYCTLMAECGESDWMRDWMWWEWLDEREDSTRMSRKFIFTACGIYFAKSRLISRMKWDEFLVSSASLHSLFTPYTHVAVVINPTTIFLKTQILGFLLANDASGYYWYLGIIRGRYYLCRIEDRCFQGSLLKITAVETDRLLFKECRLLSCYTVWLL